MSFSSLLSELDEAVDAGCFNGFGPREIPHALDDLCGRFVRSYLSADYSERELVGATGQSLPLVLRAYSERMASLAVRESSPSRLDESLLSAGLAIVIGGELTREDMLVHCLPWRAAHLLGLSPAKVFVDAAASLPDPGRSGLIAWTHRSARHQALGAMGYEEGSDADGFRFSRIW